MLKFVFSLIVNINKTELLMLVRRKEPDNTLKIFLQKCTINEFAWGVKLFSTMFGLRAI